MEPAGAHLCGDRGVEPLLGQVDLRDDAVMVGRVSKEDGAEGDDSIGQHAEAEQGEDQHLEAAPLTQEGHLLAVILHGDELLEAATAVAGAEIISRDTAGGQTLWRAGKESVFWLSKPTLLPG